ncbi:MAG: hypothetical protein PHF56_24175 [Desulfuromonadaceae bacterium]|nr:hypothetical protein [Desulfuromonadaceae bacterium]
MIDNLNLEFGNLPLKNFTTQLLEKYQTRLLTTNRPALKGTDTPREPIAQATVNRRLATIKAMFTKALDWNMVNEATCKQVHKVKLFKENVTRDGNSGPCRPRFRRDGDRRSDLMPTGIPMASRPLFR